jgi:MinD superfamily P-loop ATPase
MFLYLSSSFQMAANLLRGCKHVAYESKSYAGCKSCASSCSLSAIIVTPVLTPYRIPLIRASGAAFSIVVLIMDYGFND